MKIWTGLILTIFPVFSFALQAEIQCELSSKNAEFFVTYLNLSDTVTFTLPDRAQFIDCTSPENSRSFTSLVGDSFTILNPKKDYGGSLTIHYRIAQNGDFSLSDWLPDCGEETDFALTRPEIEDYTVLVFPFEGTNLSDTLVFSGEDNPVLIFGQFQHEQMYFAGYNYEIYYSGTLHTDFEDLINIYRSYQTLFYYFPQRSRYFIELFNLDPSFWSTSDSLFVSLTRTHARTVKKNISKIWLRDELGFDEDWQSALSDFYARVVNDEGEIISNEELLLPVPSRAYYESVFSSGMEEDEIDVDVDTMLENFTLLHFAVNSLGTASFLGRMKTFAVTSSSQESLPYFFQSTNYSTAFLGYMLTNALPFCESDPDLSMDESTAYRSDLLLPDTEILTDDQTNEVLWNNSRSFSFNAANFAWIDPCRTIPQLNFYNDFLAIDDELTFERMMAETFVRGQKTYYNETLREILSLERFTAELNNAYEVGEGAVIYVAVVKITASINGSFQTALKEVIFNYAESGSTLLDTRVRY